MNTHSEFRVSRAFLSFWGTTVVIYALAVVWFVATTSDPGIRCLLADLDRPDSVPDINGIVVRQISGRMILADVSSPTPAAGDRVLQIGERSINSFLDFSAALIDLRTYDLPPGGTISEANSSLLETRLVEEFERLPPLIEQTGTGQRYVKATFRRGTRDIHCWIPLALFPLRDVLLTFVWFILQFGILSVGGLALWARPFDRSAQVFFVMCLVTMAGFVGGFHWWTISGNLWLTVPFVISAMLVPVVTLHFFCLFPDPKPWLVSRPLSSLAAIYALPLTATVILLGLLLWVNGLFAFGGEPVDVRLWLTHLNRFIHWCLAIAGVYFALTLGAVADSSFANRNPIQQQQVKWILWAAFAATLPVGYTLYLARFHNQDFALGHSTLPMFAASLLFMAAYALGVLRHKLTLIEEVIDRGVTYYVVSLSVTTLITLAKVGSCLVGLYQQSRFPQQTPMVVAIVIASLLLLSFARDRLQQIIDRRFYRDRFHLDRAMQPLVQSTTILGNPESTAQRLLGSCRELLGVDRAALYLREGDEGAFPLMAAENLDRAPLRFANDQELLELMEAETGTQQTSNDGGHEISPAIRMLRELDLEIVHAVESDGKLTGALMLGPKRNGTRFTADDLVLLTSLGQVMRVALQGARVQQVVARLNEELQHKTARIAEQQRLISMLQTEITSRSTAPPTGTADAPLFRRELIKGNSAPIAAVLETVRKVSGSQSSVLVRGESGTGKELLALALHDNSPRRNGPLVSVHCGALSASLLESELFGHVKGAFTGAHRDKIGRFEMANGGTLFLDEIGDISMETQVKLLRVLQQREFEPVGGTNTIHVDVRLIAATHQNLERLISEGKFREDLFYRLNVISIPLPPLRERGDDVIELALHFLTRAAERGGKRISHFDDAAIEALRRYSWPGNIRELENAIERAVVLAEGESLTLSDLPLAVQQGIVSRSQIGITKPSSRANTSNDITAPGKRRGRPPRTVPIAGVGAIEEELSETDVSAALQAAGGNKAEAARLLGVPRSTLFSRMKKYRLE